MLLKSILQKNLKELELAKHYTSVVRLFEHCGIDYNSEIIISRIKKQIKIEFDQSENGLIQINEFTYNKTDVLKTLESSNALDIIKLEQLIWKHSRVLSFLEKFSFSIELLDEIFWIKQSEGIDFTIISSYLAFSFHQCSKSLINKKDFNNLSKLYKLKIHIQQEDKEAAFASIPSFIESNIAYFRNISSVNAGDTIVKMHYWFKPGWSGFLNEMPDEYHFEKVKLVEGLIHFLVEIQKKYPKKTIELSNELYCVNKLPPDIEALIRNNHEIVTSAAYGREESSSPWWVVVVIVVILRMLASAL